MKNILLTLLMTCFVGNAFADDTVTGLTVGSGTDWTMHVVLNNQDSKADNEGYCAFQLDVTLPTGFTLNGVTASSTRLVQGENVTINEESVETPFEVKYAKQSEGNVYRVLGYNLGNNNIAGDSGKTIVKLNLQSAEACDPSAVSATFSNVTFVKKDGQSDFVATDLAVTEQSGTEGKISNVKYFLRGDVNKNNEVNTTDAIKAINYYLGTDTDVDVIIADMNGDGKVNTTDAIAIINVYLEETNSSAKSATLEDEELVVE